MFGIAAVTENCPLILNYLSNASSRDEHPQQWIKSYIKGASENMVIERRYEYYYELKISFCQIFKIHDEFIIEVQKANYVYF
jgi:hypothetical protein